jgi:serine/threonine protein kinase
LGRLKLFDFGLAKRLDTAQTDDRNPENYLLTGNTGSLRYMAPEVARDEPYNLSADSYSFGILFWQLCSLTTPYVGLNQQTHALQVVQCGLRPKPDKSWPYSWTTLMTSAWDANPSLRPKMSEIVQQLQTSIDDMSFEDNVVPSRASEIRAKKKRKKVSRDNRILDIDTRFTDGVLSSGQKAQHDIGTSEIV